jgi:hypothetical protein
MKRITVRTTKGAFQVPTSATTGKGLLARLRIARQEACLFLNCSHREISGIAIN